MVETVSKIKAFFIKAEDIVKSLQTSDWEVIGGCVVGSIITFAFLGPIVGSTLLGIFMGLIIQDKINLKR